MASKKEVAKQPRKVIPQACKDIMFVQILKFCFKFSKNMDWLRPPTLMENIPPEITFSGPN